jgi:hypothetical protein
MGVLDPIADALSGKVAPAAGGTPLNQVGKGGAMTDLLAGRQGMVQKLKMLGLSSMPAGGEAELDSMWADHMRRYGAAASSMRKSP